MKKRWVINLHLLLIFPVFLYPISSLLSQLGTSFKMCQCLNIIFLKSSAIGEKSKANVIFLLTILVFSCLTNHVCLLILFALTLLTPPLISILIFWFLISLTCPHRLPPEYASLNAVSGLILSLSKVPFFPPSLQKLNLWVMELMYLVL